MSKERIILVQARLTLGRASMVEPRDPENPLFVPEYPECSNCEKEFHSRETTYDLEIGSSMLLSLCKDCFVRLNIKEIEEKPSTKEVSPKT